MTHDSAPVFSAQWYRIERLQPRLADDVRITHQHGRGTTHIVLSRDRQRGQSRLNEAAWNVIGRCDGKTTLGDIWRTLAQNTPGTVPAQHHLIDILARMVRRGLVTCTDWPDMPLQSNERREDARREQWQRLNPLAPRIRLMDPTRIVARTTLVTAWLFRPGAWLLVVLVTVAALATVVQEQAALQRAWTQWLTEPRFWLITWLVFPFIKFLHEIGHGVMLQRYGGRTPELGIALLMGMPSPYVEASDASAFTQRRERVLVSAAGILTELMIASVALLAWAWLAPGLLRDIAFVTALTGSVSTLVFNANPLIRLDGYYILTDWLHLPDLANRSNQWWHRYARHVWLGLTSDRVPMATGERLWLIGYAPASWLWRVSIFVWIAFWLGQHSRVLGAAVLLLATGLLVVAPLVRLAMSIRLGGGRLALTLAARMRLAGGALLLALVACLPMPDRAVVSGIVVASDGAQVRALRSGFMQAGENPGVLRLTDPAIDADIVVTQVRLAALRNEWITALSDAPAQARVLEAQIEQTGRHLLYLRQNQRDLELPATAEAGFEAVHSPADMQGRFVQTGELIGLLARPSPTRIQLMLDDDQAMRVRASWPRDGGNTAVSASVWTSAGNHVPMPARLLSLAPRSLQTLPSAALSEAAGGPIATHHTSHPTSDHDPAASGLEPVRPVWQLDLQIDTPVIVLTPGVRLQAGLDFGSMALGWQAARAIGQSINAGMAASWW